MASAKLVGDFGVANATPVLLGWFRAASFRAARYKLIALFLVYEAAGSTVLILLGDRHREGWPTRRTQTNAVVIGPDRLDNVGEHTPGARRDLRPGPVHERDERVTDERAQALGQMTSLTRATTTPAMAAAAPLRVAS